MKDMAMDLRLKQKLIMKSVMEQSNQSMIVDVDGQVVEAIPRGRGGAQGRPYLLTVCRMLVGLLIKQQSDSWWADDANKLQKMTHLIQKAIPVWGITSADYNGRNDAAPDL